MTIHKKGQAHWKATSNGVKVLYQQKAACLINNRMDSIPGSKARREPTRKS